MTDIVERLLVCAKFDPDQAEAADIIQRFRKSLREIRDYEGNFPVVYDGDDAIAMKEIARAALGEKE